MPDFTYKRKTFCSPSPNNNNLENMPITKQSLLPNHDFLGPIIRLRTLQESNAEVSLKHQKKMSV